MKIAHTLVVSALGSIAFASACTVETSDSMEDVGVARDATCANEDGVNASMAALAAATAKQLRRWEPQTDFRVNYGINNGTLELTAAGKDRCADNKQCLNVQAILDFQKQAANGKIVFKGGTTLNSPAFRERLKANFENQLVCNNRPDNHAADNCPTEKHDLVYTGQSVGSCELDFWFRAYKAGTTTLLQYPMQLKNQLIWVGYQNGNGTNPYLAFDVQGDDVKLDPTGGPVEGDGSGTGSCPAVCQKFSTTSITGGCCSCNNVTKHFAPLPAVPNIYICI